MQRKAADFLTYAYLVIMFCIYPFYMQNGYVDIGEAKNRFFLYTSMAALGLLCIPALINLGESIHRVRLGEQAYIIDWARMSFVDLFVIFYALTLVLSYLLSPYRQEALWGTEGWYMGTLPLLLLCGLYFGISRSFDGGKIILYLLCASSAVVFLLGICNRFSFYPIPFRVKNPDFISTLGNINWYCGYLAVISPVGIGLFLLEGESRSRWLFGLYALITFMSGFSQGGSSIFLWFAALFAVFFWICVQKKEWLSHLLQLTLLWGISSQLIRLLRFFFPGSYNYDENNLCGYFTDSSLALWIAAMIAAVLLIVMKLQKNREDFTKKVRTGFIVFLTACFLVWLLAALIVTVLGISETAIPAFFRELLELDETWGNGRGATIQTGISLFREMPLIHKLFGVGADCFSAYAYAQPGVASFLAEQFGSSRLTNAHNEILTNLVNTGLFGVCFYVGILFTFIRSCLKKGEGDPVLYLFGAAAVCCFIHNMVSFAQVLNLPYLFLFIGMGEARRRRNFQATR